MPTNFQLTPRKGLEPEESAESSFSLKPDIPFTVIRHRAAAAAVLGLGRRTHQSRLRDSQDTIRTVDLGPAANRPTSELGGRPSVSRTAWSVGDE